MLDLLCNRKIREITGINVFLECYNVTFSSFSYKSTTYYKYVFFVTSGSGKINFDGFCNIASHFLEEEDAEAMQQELKEAFR